MLPSSPRTEMESGGGFCFLFLLSVINLSIQHRSESLVWILTTFGVGMNEQIMTDCFFSFANEKLKLWSWKFSVSSRAGARVGTWSSDHTVHVFIKSQVPPLGHHSREGTSFASLPSTFEFCFLQRPWENVTRI